MRPEEEIRRARSILRAALEASGGGPLDEDEGLVTMAERAALHLDGWRSAARDRAEVATWREGDPVAILSSSEASARQLDRLGYGKPSEGLRPAGAKIGPAIPIANGIRIRQSAGCSICGEPTDRRCVHASEKNGGDRMNVPVCNKSRCQSVHRSFIDMAAHWGRCVSESDEELDRVQRVALELVTELERARAIHGDQIKLPISHRPTEWSVIGLDLEITARLDLDKAPSWAAILLEEVGGTLGAMDDPEALRAELVQVGAMTIGMIRRLDTP